MTKKYLILRVQIVCHGMNKPRINDVRFYTSAKHMSHCNIVYTLLNIYICIYTLIFLKYVYQ